MAFTVQDLRDLLRLIEAHPEWRSELRRQILTEDLLDLPPRLDRLEATVQRLAEAQLRTEQRLGELETTVGRLAEAQLRTEQRLGELETRLGELETTVGRLAEAQLRTEQRLGELIGRFDDHERRNALDMQILKNGQLTTLLQSSPHHFRLLVEHPRVLESAEVESLVDRLPGLDRIGPAQLRDLFRADLLVRGEREGTEGYLVVEASWTIGPKDIDRAQRRADVLQRAGVLAWPAVAGYRFSDDADRDPQRERVLSLMLEE